MDIDICDNNAEMPKTPLDLTTVAVDSGYTGDGFNCTGKTGLSSC